MHIEHAGAVDDELVDACARLFPQLSSSPPPTREDLAALIASPGAFLLLARDPQIIGTLTLTLYRVPTGLHALINAVVVDEVARGRGVGEALNREAIRRAQEAGAARVQLTSRNTREAAHRLYRKIGFDQPATTVFRKAL
jgi:ribosomal protein S18 acetylase RimI-like enzyme